MTASLLRISLATVQIDGRLYHWLTPATAKHFATRANPGAGLPVAASNPPDVVTGSSSGAR